MTPGAAARIRQNAAEVITVGIDVGGSRKGFHAVALKGSRYMGRFSTREVKTLTDWCRETVRAQVVAVDAPCRWSTDNHSRPAERELMQRGIWCFSTPTSKIAEEHPTNHFGWMLRGEELFKELEVEFPLCSSLYSTDQKCCFETFPHAITWHLRGGTANASKKRAQRRELLDKAGIGLAELTNIDLVDAALCAYTAYCVAAGKECVSYGEPDTGLIIVPERRVL